MEFRRYQAIYLQISDFICENILLKKWKEGDKIPSIREMAVSIEVNPNTVMRTYSYLQEKGIIFNKRGIGYFVDDGAYEKTRNLKKEDFVSHELPRFFRTMDMLKLNLNNLKQFYEKHRINQK